MRWLSLLLAWVALPSGAHAQFLPVSARDARFATPVVEGQIEEGAPRRDELGYLRVPRLQVSGLAGFSERVTGTYGGGPGTRPFGLGGQLQLEVPLSGALVIGAASAVQLRRLDANWSWDGGTESYDGRRGDYDLLRFDTTVFARVRLAVGKGRFWLGARAGWSRQRDLQFGTGRRDGLVVAPEAGFRVCRMVCTGMHLGYALRRFGHARGLQGYDPDAYGEFYGGFSFSIPLWSPR